MYVDLCFYFVYSARLEEKEMFKNIPYEKSKISIETLRASQSSVALESLNNAPVSGTGTAGAAKTKGFSRSQENMSTQASEKEIETFTEMTLNNSWILPQVTAVTPLKKTFGRNKNKNLSADDFKPVQLKTITPRKYKNHAGTYGTPSQPTPVTFVPGIGYDAGTQEGISQLSREFSSFDFSIDSNAKRAVSTQDSLAGKAPNRGQAALKPQSASQTRSTSPSSNPMTPNKSGINGEERAQSPKSPQPLSPGEKQFASRKMKSPPIAASGSVTKLSKTQDPGSGNKKAKPADRPKTGGPVSPAPGPAPFFFPNVMGAPSSPVVLTFKPISLDDYV